MVSMKSEVPIDEILLIFEYCRLASKMTAGVFAVIVVTTLINQSSRQRAERERSKLVFRKINHGRIKGYAVRKGNKCS